MFNYVLLLFPIYTLRVTVDGWRADGQFSHWSSDERIASTAFETVDWGIFKEPPVPFWGVPMEEKNLAEILENAPDNWGRWGDDDECGALNYLTADETLRGIRAVESGESVTLGLPVFDPRGTPAVPTRSDPQHHVMTDRADYEAGKAGGPPSEERVEFEGLSESAVAAYSRTAGLETAEDSVYMFLHDGTHVDALSHAWYDGELYNGVDANTTTGGLEHGSVAPLGEHGVLGRGVLLDVARHRGVDFLDPGDRITLSELRACADEQGVSVQNRDVLLLRTGWVERYYQEGPAGVDLYDEPGLTADEDVLRWFYEKEIPFLGTDTLRNEQTLSDETGTFIPLHAAFLRDLGIPLNELLKLDRLAERCADRGVYDFLFVALPLKLVGASGSPVNPVAVL